MLALRLIVEWDGVVVEDRLFRRRPLVLVGSGPAATMTAPVADRRLAADGEEPAGPEGAYAAFVRRGDGWELRLPAGVVRALAIPGQPDVDGAVAQRRVLALGGVEAARCGALVFDGAVVSFELVELAGRRDAALWGWTAMALVLALISGGGYRLVRAYGHGERPQWGETPPSTPLTALEASRLRVRWNASGPGATRPQAGHGDALHAETHDRPGAPRAQPPAPPRQDATARLGRTQRARTPTRAERIAAAEAALLNADLRTTIDQLSRASRQAPLDYEQLNWLGLAHYMQAQYDDAEHVWAQARALAPERADVVNNLANVAKRRGDLAGERALIEGALAIADEDCHALNGLALLQAKAGDGATAAATLARSDAACGGHYAYTSIQRAALLALGDDRDGAFLALETGLRDLDTLVPIKEYEVWMDLTRDPAFASLRGDARFTQLTTRYLPRAARATRGG